MNQNHFKKKHNIIIKKGNKINKNKNHKKKYQK